MISDTTDMEIRREVHRKLLKQSHISEGTIVIDELGVSHGRNRVDIAVLNGLLHGYEIKSSKDNLKRLPTQISEYSKVFQKLTLIVDQKHFEHSLSHIPHWCGVVVVNKGIRGGIHFSKYRGAQLNPQVSAFDMAHLLWRKEVYDFLTTGLGQQLNKNATRATLYNELVNQCSVKDIFELIKTMFTRRENWRFA